MTVLLIGLGGFAGAVGRYGMSLLTKGLSGDFPWGTLLVNLIGSFCIGLVYQMTLAWNIDERLSSMVMLGVLGGFTTFSTISLETLRLFEKGDLLFALLNILFSAAACVFAAWLGRLLVRTFS